MRSEFYIIHFYFIFILQKSYLLNEFRMENFARSFFNVKLKSYIMKDNYKINSIYYSIIFLQ